MRIKAQSKVILGSAIVIIVLVFFLLWISSHDFEHNGSGEQAAGRQGPLIFYCAAGVKLPVEQVVTEYEAQFNVPVQIQYGGSGTLLSNLAIAEKGDLYLAGDASFIDIARKKKLVAEAIPLAIMRPIIAVKKGNPKHIKSVADLLRSDVKVSLGNPDAASIGKQTRRAMRKLGMWQALSSAITKRGVFKPTVNDVANDIKIGAVDAGIIWDAVCRQYPELTIAAPLTDDKSFVMQVTIGVLTSSKQPTRALHFARYLGARDKGLKEFARYGYKPVEGDVWADKPEILLFSGGVNRVAIEDTIRAFEKREGCRVIRVYNGCGILVSQMKAGAQPDVYFSCDVSFMKQVQNRFQKPVNISETDILIAVQKGNPRGIHSLQDLTRKGLKLGITNPQQSALGELTRRMLNKAGLWEGILKNVRSQTPTADLLVNQLRTGTLDAVIVYEANISHVREYVDIIRIDLPSAHAVQPYAVARNTRYPLLAGRLLNAIESEASRKRYLSSGFRLMIDKP